MLTIDHVDAYYGKSQVLHGISLQVDRGEVVAVLGRNGMGKTTLVHTVMGFVRSARGTISLDGESLVGRSPEAIYRRAITLMPQGHRVFGSLSVGENLQIAANGRNGNGHWTIDEVTARLPILRDRWKQGADTLSGGEQQMLTMARTLVGNGSIVMLDEPAEGLAPAIVAIFGDIIRDLRAGGAGVLLVEQRVDFALSLADRVYVMSRGVEVFEGTAAELREAEDVTRRYLSL
jgi:branched-chain amino acid transport system ATP-binding protein